MKKIRSVSYITDSDANSAGYINTGSIDIRPDNTLKWEDDRNVALVINAPKSYVYIPDLLIHGGFYKGLEIRTALGVFIHTSNINDVYNDNMQIMADNVYIDTFKAVNTRKGRVYSEIGHPDFLQAFNHDTKLIENVVIRHYDTYSRHLPEASQVMFSENHIYRNFAIGVDSMTINTDAVYPYILNATNMHNSIFGGKNNKIQHGKGLRIVDVKHGGFKSTGNVLVNMKEDNVVELDPGNTILRTNTFPEDIFDKRFGELMTESGIIKLLA